MELALVKRRIDPSSAQLVKHMIYNKNNKQIYLLFTPLKPLCLFYFFIMCETKNVCIAQYRNGTELWPMVIVTS